MDEFATLRKWFADLLPLCGGNVRPRADHALFVKNSKPHSRVAIELRSQLYKADVPSR